MGNLDKYKVQHFYVFSLELVLDTNSNLAHFICLKAKVVKFHIQKTVAQNFSHQSSTDVTNKRLLTIEL